MAQGPQAAKQHTESKSDLWQEVYGRQERAEARGGTRARAEGGAPDSSWGRGSGRRRGCAGLGPAGTGPMPAPLDARVLGDAVAAMGSAPG